MAWGAAWTTLTLALALALAAPAAGATVDAGDEDARSWLKGDWHVHTTRSGDACDPRAEDDACGTGIWRSGLRPDEMVAYAAARGLDYVAITDHNQEPWQPDEPGPIPVVPGYEASLGAVAGPGHTGHGGIVGVDAFHPLNAPGSSPGERVEHYLDHVHEAGGEAIVNHPKSSLASPWTVGEEAAAAADAVEVWNAHWWAREEAPPFGETGGMNNPDAVAWWESLLDDGAELGAVGGSDTHWAATSWFQGVGQPTTWVYASEDPDAISGAMAAGHTFVSWDMAGPELYLEGDAACDGDRDAIPGDHAEGERVCVRATTPAADGLVRLRAGGPGGAETVATAPAVAGAEAELTPGEHTWVRAEVAWPNPMFEADEVRALTSPIYLEPAGG